MLERTVTITNTRGQDEDNNVMFIKDNKVYITILLVEQTEIRALGIGCGSDSVDILLRIGECKGASLAYSLVHIVELFD